MSFYKQGELIGISSDKINQNLENWLRLLGEELLGQGASFPPPPIDKE